MCYFVFLQELAEEMEEREVHMSALAATTQNIAEEFPNLEEEGEKPGVMDEVDVSQHVVILCCNPYQLSCPGSSVG